MGGNWVIDDDPATMTGRGKYPTVAQLQRDVVTDQLAHWKRMREQFPVTSDFARGFQDGQIHAAETVLFLLDRLQS